MQEAHPLRAAMKIAGPGPLSRGLGLSTVAIYKWLAKGRLPRTEWTGETRYAQQIEALCAGAVTAQQLLGPWPKWPSEEVQLKEAA